MSFFKHLNTINKHRKLVRKGCFRVGLYRQGLMHDLSKYSPVEFWAGVKYYQGTRSPNNAQREEEGYSASWLHHKGRNKHHYEYWIDYTSRKIPEAVCGMLPAPMPVKYIIEMLMDRIAACKVYNGDAYTDSSPIEYYRRGMEPAPLHAKTKIFLELLLLILSVKGEEYTFGFVKKELLPRIKEFDDINNLNKCIEFCDLWNKKIVDNSLS